MVNELLHSQWHGDQANRQIAERHVDNKEIPGGPGLWVADDHVTNTAVAQNAQHNKQSEKKTKKKGSKPRFIVSKLFTTQQISFFYSRCYRGQSELHITKGLLFPLTVEANGSSPTEKALIFFAILGFFSVWKPSKEPWEKEEKFTNSFESKEKLRPLRL